MSTWEAVGAVSSMVSTVTVTGALVYTARQVREARNTRAITSLLAVHKEYQAPRLNIIRRRLGNGEFDDVDAVSDADRNEIRDLLQQMELVGFLVDRRLVDLADVMSLFPRLPQTFNRALPHVEQHRRRFPGYAAKAEVLVRRYEAAG